MLATFSFCFLIHFLIIVLLNQKVLLGRLLICLLGNRQIVTSNLSWLAKIINLIKIFFSKAKIIYICVLHMKNEQ